MTLYVLCGIPGSGKTTFATQLAQKQNTKLYSYDAVRRTMKSNTFNDVCQFIYQSINMDLRNGYDVIYDAPNEKLDYRQDILEKVSNTSCKKVCIVLVTPFAECLKRNANREVRLPDFVLHDIRRKFNPPTLDEGWDEIREVKTYETDFTGD